MQTETTKEIGAVRQFAPNDDRNVKSVRQVAADAIAKRRTNQMSDALETAGRKIPGALICIYYAQQPGAKILPDGVIELPNYLLLIQHER